MVMASAQTSPHFNSMCVFDHRCLFPNPVPWVILLAVISLLCPPSYQTLRTAWYRAPWRRETERGATGSGPSMFPLPRMRTDQS